MKEITPLQKAKVSDEVLKALEKLIIENNMQPGDKLPSQSELTQKLQVGSRSVREAIRSLESRGMVETRQGKGVFVKNRNMDYFLEMLRDSLVYHFPDDKDLLVDLTYVRKMIEINVISDITGNPPKGLISQLAKLIEELDQKAEENDLKAYNLLDVQFHKTIIQASNNKIIISLYNHLFSLLVESFTKTGAISGSIEDSRIQHKQLLEAILASDTGKAKSIMERHINSSLKKLIDMQGHPK